MQCYCGAERGTHTGHWRSTSTGPACRDIEACDQRDADRHKTKVRELRRRKKAGDELTEAEGEELRNP